ncbi:Crp/Fnr family transcriptional regulator [Aureimonas pseudogalii]|uniref:CRP-like cAMP-binding protein n=1 Tax=Aureimonas pseudogalii TaxID=1744844 RepID=A0A7W6H6E1_9HYPH|nr:Crp/Fnr family transcriptional regulator [Aureimonas pseudogalii]MBB3999409.1 CRP-like cAMP-binding protein [Aureimonas pseudogalii]
MAPVSRTSVRNLLLKALPDESFAKLQPHLEEVPLPTKAVLVESNEPTEHVHFLESGLASIVATSHTDGEEIEVGHIGREGLSGFHVVHEVDRTPQRTFMQAAGAGLRMPAAALKDALKDDLALRHLLLRYIHTYEVQLSQSALANGRYNINERLARWILMSHDRLDGDDLPLTHEFLSLMLGVRRSGVTNEIHILEGVGLIKATRACIQVLNREGLLDLAGGCYGVPEAEYERLIGSATPSDADPAGPAPTTV